MPITTTIDGYIALIERSFCPYIAPSKRKDVFFISDCHSNEGDPNRVANIFLTRLIDEIQEFRSVRHTSPATSHLFCRNVVLHCALGDSDIREIFGWIHYALKQTFAGTGVVFGKFYKGHGFRDVRNEAIPDPPLPFISIRTVIEKIDPQRFYSFVPEYAPQAAQWHDDLSITSVRMFREKYRLSDSDDWYEEVRSAQQVAALGRPDRLV